MSELTPTQRKFSQIFVDYVDETTPDEIVKIVLPLEQVVDSEDNKEESLSVLKWKIVK